MSPRSRFSLAAAKLPIKTRFVARLGELDWEGHEDEDVRRSVQTDDQLKDEIAEAEARSSSTCASSGHGQLEKTSRIREVRRDIARHQDAAGDRARPSGK